MFKNGKRLTFVLLLGGATLLQGCLGAFWQGFWNTGWPENQRWINLGIDVVNEALLP